MGLVAREQCPACGDARRRTLLERQYSDPRLVALARSHYERLPEGRFEEATRGFAYVLARCEACGLNYQVWVPDGPLLGEIYDVWCDATASREKNRRKLDGGRAAKLIQDALVMVGLAGRSVSSLRALDYGAGWGGWCMAARVLGLEVAGYEVGRDRIEELQRQGIPVADERSLARGDFDLINSEQVFEHLIAPRDVIAVLAQSLRPGGVLRISVPSGELLRPRLAREDWSASRSSVWSLNPVMPLEHVNAFTARSLQELGRTAGLASIRAGLRADYANLVATGSLAKALLRPLYFRMIGRNLTAYFRRAN